MAIWDLTSDKYSKNTKIKTDSDIITEAKLKGLSPEARVRKMIELAKKKTRWIPKVKEEEQRENAVFRAKYFNE